MLMLRHHDSRTIVELSQETFLPPTPKGRCRMHRWLPIAVLVALIVAPNPVMAGYVVTNLVSDLDMGAGVLQDPSLVNPWGLTFRGASPFWVANNGIGNSTLYNTSTGAAVKQGLTVSIPGSAPITGTVGNLSSSFNADLFLFAAETGGIYGWRQALGTTAETLVPPNSSVYKGLAISGSTLYAAEFSNGAIGRGQIDIFAGGFGSPVHVTDSTVPNDYGPFGIQLLNGKIYVTFAEQDPSSPLDDLKGAGHGFVDVLDPVTNTLTRLISNGQLNSPWGLARAPSDFGEFSGDLLVGNFGNGLINAFDPITGAFRGTLTDKSGSQIQIDGLWALVFGNGSAAGPTNRLFFTAGIQDEEHGLFGAIGVVPAPTSLALFAAGVLGLAVCRRRLRGRP